MNTNLIVKIGQLRFEKEHATRGIGMYTKLLVKHLEQLKDLEILPTSDAKSKPDIIHYPSFDFFFPTLPFSFSIPTVVTIHDVIPLLYPEKYPRGIKGSINLKRQMLALKTAKAIITDSETSKRDITKYLKIAPRYIHVVPLAPNPEIESQSEKKIQEIKIKYDLPETYVLYVGDIGYNKNIPQLIKMLKFLPEDVHLVCIGKNFKPQSIPEWNWIETQTAMSDVESRLHFVTNLGVDALEDLGAVYTGALCYVQPSLYEGFGLPVLEAMRAKTPVVSSNTPALLEIGSDAVLFTEPTAEKFSEQVQVVLNWSQKKRADCIKNAFLWSETYTWNKTAKETTKVYKDIIK